MSDDRSTRQLASPTDDELLGGLMTDLPYLQTWISEVGFPRAMTGFVVLLHRVRSDASTSEVVRKLIDVLRPEGALFLGNQTERGRGREFPSFANQMVNAALRVGRPGMWRRIEASESQHDAWLLRSWSTGTPDHGVRQTLPLPGDRDSYSWDIYDSGPAGCKAEVRVDLAGKRLLTQTRSLYLAGQTHQTTVRRRVWALDTGALIESRDPNDVGGEASTRDDHEWDEDPSSSLDVRSLPADLPSRLAPGVNPDRVELKVARGSLNSDEVLFSWSVKDERGSSPPRLQPWLHVLHRKTGHFYRTSVPATGLRIAALVRLADGLTAFAIDGHKDVWRIQLVPWERSGHAGDAAPVISAAMDSRGRSLACLTEGRLQVHSTGDGRILQSMSLDRLRDDEPIATESGRWAYARRFSAPRLDVWPAEFSNGCWNYMDSPGAHVELETPEPGLRPDDAIHFASTSPRGRHFVQKRRCSVAVWNLPSGRWLRLLGEGPRYGGGGSLYGLAVSPDDRYVLSSPEGKGVAVWDLDEPGPRSAYGAPNRDLAGLRGIDGVTRLAFFWGGSLVAAATEDHRLLVCRFFEEGEILAAIRLEGLPVALLGQPYGDRVLALTECGTLVCYRYVPLPAADRTHVEGDRVVFRHRAPAASRVCVAGSFNDWSRFPLDRTGEGVWEGALALEDGHHEYKIVVDEESWELDPHVPFQPGPHGPNNHLELPQDGVPLDLPRATARGW